MVPQGWKAGFQKLEKALAEVETEWGSKGDGSAELLGMLDSFKARLTGFTEKVRKTAKAKLGETGDLFGEPARLDGVEEKVRKVIEGVQKINLRDITAQDSRRKHSAHFEDVFKMGGRLPRGSQGKRGL